MAGIRKKVDKGIAYLKRNGIRQTCYRAYRKAMLTKAVNYEHWLKHHSASSKMLERQRQMPMNQGPMIEVILYPGNSSNSQLDRKKTLEALEKQTYQKYHLWSAQESEEEPAFDAVSQENEKTFFLFVPEGVILLPEALYEFARVAEKSLKKELIYSDQDEISADGKHFCDPFMKPKYDPVFWQEMDYIGPVVMVSSKAAKQCGIFEGGTKIRYDAIRSGHFQSKQVYRIPRVLYHVPWKWEMGQVPVKACCDGYLSPAPLLSVIIPNKDYREGLRECVTSVIEQGGYPNLEILIVENNSTENATYQCYENLKEKYPQVKIMNYTDKFNYSLINNEAVKNAEGEYLLFLNNDTKVKEAGSIRKMMEWIFREEQIGAVGARLVFGDGTIQHGGVVLGYGGIAGHAFEGMPEEDYDQLLYSRYARQMSAVTAACMIVRRKAFEEVKGFEPELGVAYNDIDFCMKLRKKKWQVVYEPKAKWYHYESQTRGLEMTKEKAERVKMEAEFFCARWKNELIVGDPFYNPNLTLEKPDFTLARKMRVSQRKGEVYDRKE